MILYLGKKLFHFIFIFIYFTKFFCRYNGQPKSSATPILDAENVVVIGNGNVAIDCSRILLSPTKKLAHTDLPEYALKSLRQSRVCSIKILGRRGPKEVFLTSLI